MQAGRGIGPISDIRHLAQLLRTSKKVLPICDHVELFDNTESFRRVAIFEFGACIDKTEKIPPWCDGLFKG